MLRILRNTVLKFLMKFRYLYPKIPWAFVYVALTNIVARLYLGYGRDTMEKAMEPRFIYIP